MVVGFEQGAIRSDLACIRFTLTLWGRMGRRAERKQGDSLAAPAALQAKEREVSDQGDGRGGGVQFVPLLSLKQLPVVCG